METYIGETKDFSLFLHVLWLWLLPFLHEDFAIVFGAYVVSKGALSLGAVAAILYSGIVASDIALFAVGCATRRLHWLQGFAARYRLESIAEYFRRHIVMLVAVCRVVPGMMFIAFIACGWAGVPLRRFVFASLITSALYVPVMLGAAVFFEMRLLASMGPWTWVFLIAAVISLGMMRKRIFDLDLVIAGGGAQPMSPTGRGEGQAPAGARVAPAEIIPPVLFYAPLVASWLWRGVKSGSQTLPACANPMIPTGGMWGESKSDCLLQVSAAERRWLANFIVIEPGGRNGCHARGAAAEAVQRALAVGLAFPMVAKPDIGWHGYGVRVIGDEAQLADYLEAFRGRCKVILQQHIAYPGEAAVLYARLPGAAHGRIESLTLRQAPQVVGDGVHPLRDLIRFDPRARWKSRLHLGRDGSHHGLSDDTLDRVPEAGEIVTLAFVCNQRAGGIYQDMTDLVTSELTARVDAISQSMPEFHYGRFDLRFAALETLRAGQDFAIVEINGIGGEAIDAWDPGLSIEETYRRLSAQQALLFEIGALNRQRGFQPPRARAFLGPLLTQTRLIKRYPKSQ